MRTENNYEQNNSLSEEKLKWLDEVSRLGKKLKAFYNKPDFDSIKSEETSEKITYFEHDLIGSLKGQKKEDGTDLELKDLFLWSLFAPEISSDPSTYDHFDTEDQEIEEFIESLVNAVPELNFEVKENKRRKAA
jgi:hypothetical protein